MVASFPSTLLDTFAVPCVAGPVSMWYCWRCRPKFAGPRAGVYYIVVVLLQLYYINIHMSRRKYYFVVEFFFIKIKKKGEI